MAITKVDDRGLNTPVDLLDNEKIRFGTGNDLEIYHDGSNSYIEGTSNTWIKNTGEQGFTNANEYEIRCTANGAVKLYYDNSTKFETTSYGSAHTGIMRFENSGDGISFYDSRELKIGSGDDLKLYHDGSHSFIHNTTGQLCLNSNEFGVANASFTENIIRGSADGDVKLFYDGVEKFKTNSTGILVGGDVDNSTSTQGVAVFTNGYIRTRVANTSATAFVVSVEGSGASKAIITGAGNGYFTGGLDVPDSAKIQAGDGDDLQIYHDATDSWIKSSTGNLNITATSTESGIIIKPNADVEIYYNDSKKLETASGGVRVIGNLLLDGDDRYIKLGAADDLQIYHDGSSSYIDEVGSGSLKIQTNGAGVDIQKGSSETIARFMTDSAVELYYDNVKKLETTSGGIDVTGTATTDGLQITGASYFNADAVFDGATAGRDCWWDRSDNSFKFYDNAYLKIGNDTDLQLYHDGSNSYIHHDGAGDFTVKAPGTGENVWIQAGAGVYLNSAVNESGVDVVQNSSVKLYYDNSKKFETDSYGAKVYGNLVVGTDAGELLFTNPDGHSPKFKENGGALEVWTNNTKRWTVESNGNNVYEDDVKIFFGSGNDFRFWHDGSDNYIYGTGNHAIIFGANDSEKLRLAADGEFRVQGGGTDVANRYFRFSVHSTSPLFEINHTAQNSNHTLIYFKAAGSAIGEIKQDGDGTITYADSSDYRLKENIVDISDGITRLKQLKPRRFNFKSKPGYTKDGFIAHELQTVVPESVNGAKDEVVTADSKANIPQLEDKEIGDPVYQTVDKSRIIPLLTAALQEAVSKIETLEAKVAALESS